MENYLQIVFIGQLCILVEWSISIHISNRDFYASKIFFVQAIFMQENFFYHFQLQKFLK